MAENAKVDVKVGEHEEIEIPVEEKVEESPIKLSEEDLGGLSPQEIELARSQGMIEEKKVEEPKVEEKVEKADVKVEQKQEAEEKKEEERPTWDEMDGDEKKEREGLKDYNNNEKALYWKWKKGKLKRQQAEAERDHHQIQLAALKKELEEIKSRNVENDNLDDIGEEPEEKPLTKRDLEDIEAKKSQAEEERLAKAKVLKQRLDLQLAEGYSKYENLDNLLTMAEEVIRQDASNGNIAGYAETYNRHLVHENGQPVEYAVQLAKFHPNYGKTIANNGEETKEETKKTDDIDRVLANSEKTPSSASLGGRAGSNRRVSVNDITVQEASRLSSEQFGKLPKEVRQRLLKESCA